MNERVAGRITRGKKRGAPLRSALEVTLGERVSGSITFSESLCLAAYTSDVTTEPILVSIR